MNKRLGASEPNQTGAHQWCHADGWSASFGAARRADAHWRVENVSRVCCGACPQSAFLHEPRSGAPERRCGCVSRREFRCFRCSSRKFTASEALCSAEILACARSGDRENSKTSAVLPVFFAVFRSKEQQKSRKSHYLLGPNLPILSDMRILSRQRIICQTNKLF